MCQHLQICIVFASYRDDLTRVIPAILTACALAAGTIDLDRAVPSLEELFLRLVKGAELT